MLYCNNYGIGLPNADGVIIDKFGVGRGTPHRQIPVAPLEIDLASARGVGQYRRQLCDDVHNIIARCYYYYKSDHLFVAAQGVGKKGPGTL